MVDLVLGGDDHGVEQAALGSIVQGVGQRDGGTEVDRLHLETNGLNPPTNMLCIVSEE